MSDSESASEDERELPDAKRPRLHFGSLEEAERQRRENAGAMSSAIQAGIEAGNINITSKAQMDDVHSIDPIKIHDPVKEGVLAEFERRRKAREIAAPTDDLAVRARLRELGEPITLFGEDKAGRRDRLKDILVTLGDEAFEKLAPVVEKERAQAAAEQVVWYHEGPPEVEKMRLYIADYSLPRARKRLAAEKEASGSGSGIVNLQDLYNRMKNVTAYASQIGGERPVSCVQYAPDGKMAATADWTGLLRLWEVPACKQVHKLRGHNDKAGWLAWHPGANLTQSRSAVNLASCGHDGSVLLWNQESETPMATLSGHDERVARVAFHPSGRFLGTTCFDHSWRLWDVEAQKELIHQEGHSRAVCGIAFQKDGALVATSGMDAIGRLWDLRTGRCIFVLKGHVKPVLSIDFHPDSYHIATGSEDHSIKIWDIRHRRELYTLPAHTNLVSSVKFEPVNGRFLVSSSFDNTVKVWSHPQWTILKVLEGHEGKVLSADISPDGSAIASSSFDRTYKLWSHLI